MWQTDVIPIQSSMVVTQSQQDNSANTFLKDKTISVEVDGILFDATPSFPSDEVRGQLDIIPASLLVPQTSHHYLNCCCIWQDVA